MDQGLAAWGTGAIVAVAGLGGTLVGGLITAKVTRTQVRDQAAADHGHWLREQRIAAYRELLAEWDAAVRDIAAQVARLADFEEAFSTGQANSDPEEVETHYWQQVLRRIDAVASRTEQVTMLGPAEVVAGAEAMRDTLNPLRAGDRYLVTTWEDAQPTFTAARAAFVEAARRQVVAPSFAERIPPVGGDGR
ncbi:hypothetical protein ACFO3J_31625 [Streptomyces polygonati]|uniref:Secreted protein n=1 Tax=Streptomyces polygonati TaxID=1617087 RepID=A0ABV8HYI8_9ACTN